MGTNEQVELENLDSLVEQRSCLFELEDEENELPSTEHQENEKPTKETNSVPREWGHQPHYPHEYRIRDSSQWIRTRLAFKKAINLALLLHVEPKNV